MIRNLSQNKRLHGLLGKLSISKEVKEELVFQFTSERTTHTKDMNIPECQALINFLSVQVGEANKKIQTPDDKMRKKILSLCYEMHWTVKGKLDWERINNWMLKYGYLHKPINEYKVNELPKLVSQFENQLKSFYAKG